MMGEWPAGWSWSDGVDARSVFRALEVPWEGATSRELFAKVMGRLEAKELGWRAKGRLARQPDAGSANAKHTSR
jgi:hypothetical protein